MVVVTVQPPPVRYFLCWSSFYHGPARALRGFLNLLHFVLQYGRCRLQFSTFCTDLTVCHYISGLSGTLNPELDRTRVGDTIGNTWQYSQPTTHDLA